MMHGQKNIKNTCNNWYVGKDVWVSVAFQLVVENDIFKSITQICEHKIGVLEHT